MWAIKLIARYFSPPQTVSLIGGLVMVGPRGLYGEGLGGGGYSSLNRQLLRSFTKRSRILKL